MNQQAKTIIQCGCMLLALYVLSGGLFYWGYSAEHTRWVELESWKSVMTLIFAPVLFRYGFQLISLPFYPLIERFRNCPSEINDIKVSVLIPAWNESIGILKTIESVVKTNYPLLEIIVINDGSTDNTHQLVTQYIRQFNDSTVTQLNKPVIRYLKLANGGKARALNRALAKAGGDIVITLDADSVMDKQMISHILKRFSDEKVGAVAGNIIIGNRRKPIELIQQLEYVHGFCLKRADSNFDAVHIIGGAAAAYRRDILLELGGFDESIITEDVELSVRMLAAGYKTRYAANAVVYTEGPSDWQGLMNQRLRWKYGRVLTYLKHKSLFLSSKPQHTKYLSWFVLPLAVYIELLLLCEPLFLTFFYSYLWLTGNVQILLVVAIAVSALVTLQILFDSKKHFHRNLLLLAPVGWLVFQIIDLVELQALWRSLYRLYKNQSLRWQSWARTGIVSQSVLSSIDSAVVNEQRKSA